MDEKQQIPQQPQYFYEEDTISLSDILLVLAKNLKLLIIIPLVFGVITAFNVLFMVGPSYISSAKIMSSGGGSSPSQLQGLAAQFGVSVPGGSEGAEWVYPDIIKSRTLARALLIRKFDTNKYGPQKSLLQILTYGDEEPEVNPNTLMKFGIESYLGMIDVEQDRQSQIYTVTVSAFEPQFAADLCAALIEELDEHQRVYKTEKVKETRLFIEGRIVEVQKELEKAEEDLKVFRDRNRQIGSSPALLLEQQRLSRETAVLTGVFTTLKQQLEMTKIEEVKESALVQVLDPPEAPLYRDSPKRRRSVFLSLILGFGLAVGLAFVKEYASNSDDEEKGKLREITELTKSNISDLIPFRRKRR
ncbi:MAG TPA: hypothetical protein EYO07_05280 [Candidatus Marinimicrobia bacterium]|nr:hypothetical protein [Candidatus Neomarinimicrobiota bacterium]